MPLDNLDGADTFDIVKDKLNDVIDELNNHPNDAAWTALSLTGYTGNVYYKKIGGVVYLRGSAVRSSGTILAGESPFTLPVGYRPIAQYTIPLLFSGGGVTVYQAAITTGGLIVASDDVTGRTTVHYFNVFFHTS